MPFLVYLLALAVFAQGTSEFMLGGLLPGISADLGVPLSAAGLLTSGFALGMVVGAPALAVLGRRLPARATLAGLLAVFVLAHVAGALAPGFGLLLGTRVVAALANAGFLAITMSLLGRIVAPGQHARALAVVLGGTTLALIAGVPLGAFVGEHLGWRATMWGVAAICVPALIAILCAAPARGAETDSSTLVLRAELAALQQRPLQRSIALAVLANAAVFCSFTYLAVIARQGAGISESLVPLLLVVFGGGAYAGVMVAGRLADRHWAPVITFGIPLAYVGWLGFAALVASPPAVWLLSGALGAVSFAVGSTLISRVLANAANAPTLGGAYSTVALNAGAIAGPAAGGLALAPFGAQGPLLVSAACMIMAAIVWWPARASS